MAEDDARRTLVSNERLKLLANFMNGAAVAVFAIGCVAPILAGSAGAVRFNLATAISSGICFVAACCLHYLASIVLKGLKP
jgi:hypothetical protein